MQNEPHAVLSTLRCEFRTLHWPAVTLTGAFCQTRLKAWGRGIRHEASATL
jgi:hypothetical protein